uniref:Hypothetical secreted peptide n=1 Tax=Triatoma matogrossensis TaxID=162370 RepID=E2J7C7_9HEMI
MNFKFFKLNVYFLFLIVYITSDCLLIRYVTDFISTCRVYFIFFEVYSEILINLSFFFFFICCKIYF